MKFLPYGKQYITNEDISGVSRVLESDWLTRGPKVGEFEKAVADYCGAQYAVAFSNGTAALMGAYFAVDLGPHDRFITTPNTFVATAGPGVASKALPVFVDIDLETGNMNLEQTACNLNKPATRGKEAVIPVHFSGIPVDMKQLSHMIKNPNTVIIEDAAHAIGGSYSDGKKIGSCEYSDMTVFSFHPVKTITTGEGGMVTTNDEEYCRRLKLFRNNGIEREGRFLEGQEAPWYYEVKAIAGNYNFTDIQAALGLSQLQKLDQFVSKRRELVSVYREHLEGSRINPFTDQYDSHTAFHLFVVQIDFQSFGTTRTEVMTRLMQAGIGTQLHYIPLYRHPFFIHKYGCISDYFPKMEQYYQQALSLPLFYEMDAGDVGRVCSALKDILYRA